MKQRWGIIHMAFLVLSLSREASSQSLVDPSRLESTLREAFAKARSHMQPDEKESARNYIKNVFTELNDTLFHEQTFTKPYNGSTYDGWNLAWVLPGQRFGTSDDALLIIGSHYDTVVNTNGVNDNGSGMAVLLEVAKALSQQSKYSCTRLNSVMFVAFDWEETGLTGSGHFVDGYLVPHYLQRYNITQQKFQGALVMDTIMNWDDTPNSQVFPTGFDLVFPNLQTLQMQREHRGDSLVAAARQDDARLLKTLNDQWISMPQNAKYGLSQIVLPIMGRPSIGRPGFEDLYRSDHYNFWNHQSSYAPFGGLKALFLTDTANFRGYMQTCYHKPCDSLDQLTAERVQFLAQIAETLTRVALEKATGRDDLQCAGPPDVTTGVGRLMGQYHVTLLAFLIGCWTHVN